MSIWSEPAAVFALCLVFFIVLPLAFLRVTGDVVRWLERRNAHYGDHDECNIEVKPPEWLPHGGQLPVCFIPEPEEVIEDDLSTAGMFVEETTPTEIIPRVDPQPEPPAISDEIPRQRAAGGRVSAVHSGDGPPTEPECTVFQDQVSAA